MENILQKIEETTAYLQAKGFTNATTAIVLGTGLGAGVPKIDATRMSAARKNENRTNTSGTAIAVGVT